jgi:uncharacterized membrane protein YkvA (DUF1232 family)
MKWAMRFLPNVINPNYWKNTWADLSLTWRLMGDRRVPIFLKLMPVLVVLYLLSPLDLIPGFIPIVGQLDDLGLLLIGIAAFIRLAPREIVSEHRLAAGQGQEIQETE